MSKKTWEEKQKDYEKGYSDGRWGFFGSSCDSDYRNGNFRGRQEYDYWQRQRKEEHEAAQQAKRKEDGDSDGSFLVAGAIFGAFFLWIFIYLPFLLFLGEGNLITKIIFWGGMAVVMLITAVTILCAGADEREKKQKEIQAKKFADEANRPKTHAELEKDVFYQKNPQKISEVEAETAEDQDQ